MVLKQAAPEYVKTFAGYGATKGSIVAREPKGATGKNMGNLMGNTTNSILAIKEPVIYSNSVLKQVSSVDINIPGFWKTFIRFPPPHF